MSDLEPDQPKKEEKTHKIKAKRDEKAKEKKSVKVETSV